MEKSDYNCGGGDASRGRGGGSGCGRGVSSGGRGGSGCGRGVSSGGRGGYGGGRAGNNYQKYHQGRYQTGGAAGNSGDGGGNNCQQHNQGHQSGGYGRRRRGGDRSGTHMGTNPPPAQPWEDRPVQGGQGETQMGTNPPPVQGDQGGTQWLESATGQGAGATGGRGAWSGGPPRVAGRGSWASAVGGGAGAGQAQRGILFLFLFTMLPLLPMGDEWRCSLLLQLHHQLVSHHHRLHLRLHLTISSVSNALCSSQGSHCSPSRVPKLRGVSQPCGQTILSTPSKASSGGSRY